MDADGNDRPRRRGFDNSRPVRSLFGVARGVLFGPTRFFAGLREERAEEDGVAAPLLFAGICVTIGMVLSIFAEPLDPLAPVFSLSHTQGDIAPRAYGLAVASSIVLGPILASLSVCLVAVVQHLLVMLFVRERRGFRTTFLVVAYEGAFSLFAWIPVLGTLISVLYGAYVTAVGLREMHETTMTRALLAVLVPYLLGLAFFVTIVVWAFLG